MEKVAKRHRRASIDWWQEFKHPNFLRVQQQGTYLLLFCSGARPMLSGFQLLTRRPTGNLALRLN